MNAPASASAAVNAVSAALGYASVGMRVFPVCPNRKKPLVFDNLAAATTDAGQIKQWWAQWPNAMIGFTTGALKPSGEEPRYGVIIVDVDKGSGGFDTLTTLEKKLGSLPRGLVTHTPSGGLHIWLRWPRGLRIKSLVGKHGLGDGVDIRGCLADGSSKGYVVMPPSRRADGKSYCWAATVTYPILCDEPGEIPATWLFALAFSSRERLQLAKYGIIGPESFAGVPLAQWQQVAQEKLASAFRKSTNVPEGPLPLEASERLRSYIDAAVEAELTLICEAPAGLQESTASTSGLKLHGLIKGAAVCGLDVTALEAVVAERFCAAMVAMAPRDITNPWTLAHARLKWERTEEAAEPRDLFAIAHRSQPAGEFADVGVSGHAGDSDDEVTHVVNRLAALSLIRYEREREPSAKALGVRVTVLDSEVAQKRRASEPEQETVEFLAAPEPWPEPVNGEQLIGEIVSVLTRYIVLPDLSPEAIALWVLHSHCHDAAAISPILAFESPEKRCGKTTAMGLVACLVPKALLASNITAASLFRIVEKFQPTLLIDEADTFLGENDDLRGVLNSGHNRRSAHVIRTVGDDHDPKCFSTWSPKAIALIGELPDTLQDRAIAIRLRRKRTFEVVERLRLDKIGPFAELQSKAARWGTDHLNALKRQDPSTPAGIDDRAADNWRPLFAIADEIGGPWSELSRRVATNLSGGDRASERDQTDAVQLLKDIRGVFEELKVSESEPHELLMQLCNLPESPWADRGFGKPVTGKAIAALLKPFDVKSRRDKSRRYYAKVDFEDAWLRYLPT